MKKSIIEKYKDSKVIRLVYVAAEKYIDHSNRTCFGQTLGISSPFMLPEGMSFENACKTISYLSEKVESEENLEPASNKSVARVSNILEEYGFKKLNAQDYGYEVTNTHSHGEYLPLITAKNLGAKKAEGVVDFITVGANDNLFKHTHMNKRYFDWFIPGVKEDELNLNSHEEETNLE